MKLIIYHTKHMNLQIACADKINNKMGSNMGPLRVSEKNNLKAINIHI